MASPRPCSSVSLSLARGIGVAFAVIGGAASAHADGTASTQPAASARPGANLPLTLTPRTGPPSSDDATISGPMADRGGWYSSLPVSLSIVLAVIVACAYIAKRHFRVGRNGGPAPGIEIVARSYLSTKQSVCLVRAGRRHIMIGVTPDRITHLTDLEDAEAAQLLDGGSTTNSTRMDRTGFHSLVDEQATVFRKDASLRTRGPRDVDVSQYGQTRGQLDGLLGKIRAFAQGKGAS